MMRQLAIFITLLALSLSLTSAASAQASVHSFVEGHVFDAKTLRPLRRASVTLVGSFRDFPVSFSSADTDSGGLYSSLLFATPELDIYDRIDLVVQCKLGTSGKLVRYSAPFYNPLVGGRVYSRDVYLKLPDGETGCRAGSFSLPAAPTGR